MAPLSARRRRGRARRWGGGGGEGRMGRGAGAAGDFEEARAERRCVQRHRGAARNSFFGKLYSFFKASMKTNKK